MHDSFKSKKSFHHYFAQYVVLRKAKNLPYAELILIAKAHMKLNQTSPIKKARCSSARAFFEANAAHQ
jgi:hypothetical protein